MSEVKVSFIIPHKGREEMLLQTLRSIQSQVYGPAGVEIILISQNESLSDELAALVKELSIELVHCMDGRTISALRNLGVSKSKGDYLAFLDADVELSENWLQVMIRTLTERAGTVLVSAHQINGINAPSLEKIRTALSNAELDCAVQFLPGRNLFLSREIFERVGGFPEHLVTCEDYYFTERVSQFGELYYTSEACYVHIGEDKDYLQMFRKEIWRGQSNLASIKGRKIPLREWPSFIVPTGLLVLIIVALCAALASSWSISLLALLLFCLPVAAYSSRLKRLAGSEVSIGAIFKFYGLFLPARALGTLSGALKEIKSNSHSD